MIHTRELCYFSGSFFLERIADAMEERGHEVLRMNLTGDDADWDCLESCLGPSYDAIIDINSKLPYLVMDDGSLFLNHVNGPFYNYILDHPLYHHPGLVFPLENYHALAIDHEHEETMRRHYPHLRSVDYLPMAGTKALSDIPFGSRRIPILFTGTYLDKDPLEAQVEKLGGKTQELIHLLVENWKCNQESMETAIVRLVSDMGLDEEQMKACYHVDGIMELMNHVYLADKICRNRERNKVLSSIIDAGLPLTILGDGWERAEWIHRSNVTCLPSRAMASSYEVTQDAKISLDVNPLFLNGLHDRVSSSLANACLTVSNMPGTSTEYLKDGENILYYSSDDTRGLIDRLQSLSAADMEEIAGAGFDTWQKKLTWQKHAESLERCLLS